MDKELRFIPIPKSLISSQGAVTDKVLATLEHDQLPQEKFPDFLDGHSYLGMRFFLPKSGTGRAVGVARGSRWPTYDAWLICDYKDGEPHGYLHAHGNEDRFYHRGLFPRIGLINRGELLRYWSLSERYWPGKQGKIEVKIRSYREGRRAAAGRYVPHGMVVEGDERDNVSKVGYYEMGTRWGTWKYYREGLLQAVENIALLGGVAHTHGRQEAHHINYDKQESRLSQVQMFELGKPIGNIFRFGWGGEPEGLRVVLPNGEIAEDSLETAKRAGIVMKGAPVRKGRLKMPTIVKT